MRQQGRLITRAAAPGLVFLAILAVDACPAEHQVDDLLEQFREFHNGSAEPTLRELRESYDLLLLKVLSLLQDKDARLARDLVASREAIWGVLMDPAKFRAL